ncbi:MAG: 16S rRNA (uracil(1498)-N(3))-methyltransferase [Chloroflexota bacterium]|nr:16S rRNA (uracil(1498)-N(3))-methyltransferase [Chloroflexota bacterium]
MQRFFVDPTLPLEAATELTLPAGLAHQVGHVLRLRPGAHILLLDNSGWESEVELTAFDRSAIQGRVLARRLAQEAAGPAVTLYACLLKGEKFEWMLQKATELGVSAVVPVISERTVAGGTKPDRWERIVREAAEQSRRARLPLLHVPQSWATAVSGAAAHDVALVPWEEADGLIPLAPLVAQARQAARVALLIGPEGGLTAAEVQVAAAAGVQPVSLGPRILRAETAALAALALLLIPTD